MYYKEVVKSRKEHTCKGCSGKIEKGDNIVWHKYFDGFRRKVIGAYHENCFKEEYLKEKQIIL